MPQPITHYLVIEEALRNAAPEIWAEKGNFAGFGSFGPDLFYVKDVILSKFNPADDYEFLSDGLHAEKSFDFLCTMLDIAKTAVRVNREAAEKQLAYVLGYYAHVITDCVIHPYIYRHTHDHWKYHKPEKNYNAHKRTEALIDCHILNEKGKKDSPPNSYAVSCKDDVNDDLLDMDIAGMLADALIKVYIAILHQDFLAADIKKANHPIHDSYKGFRHIVDTTYTAQNILYDLRGHFSGNKLLQKLTAADIAAADELHGPWLPNGLSNKLIYSVSDLFAMAVTAVTQFIGLTLKFWSSDGIDAKKFFLQNPALYQDDNWNLDTGLPTRYNSDPTNLVIDDSRFDFGIDILAANYTNLRTIIE